MFCKNCGSNLKDGSTFCHNCGSPVNDYVVNNTVVSAPAPVVQNVQNIPNVPPIYNAPVNPPIYQGVPIQNVPLQNIPMQNVPVQNIPVHPQNPQIYSYPVYEVPKKNADIFSILSLVFGILGTQIAALFFIFSPLAIIFGIIGRKKSKSGMALAGIIIGAITFTILILYIVISVIGYATTDTLDFFNDGLYF